MKRAKTIAGLLLILACAGAASASAQQEPAGTAAAVNPPGKTPQAQEERAGDAVPPRSKASAENAPAPPRHGKPIRRRSVQQVVEPAPPPSPTLTYGPTLSPRAPSTAAPAIGLPPVSPPPPAPLNTCAGNACTDASGGTYNAGVGNAAVNSQGRLCNRVGNTMQCF